MGNPSCWPKIYDSLVDTKFMKAPESAIRKSRTTEIDQATIQSDRTVQNNEDGLIYAVGKRESDLISEPAVKESLTTDAPSEDSATGAIAPTVKDCLTVASVEETLPAEPEYVCYHKMDEAQLYALFMEEIGERLAEAPRKTEAWAQITEDYNEKRLIPELRRLKGRRSERGLRHWWQKWNENNQDMFVMIHKNTAQIRGRKVTQLEQDYLLAKLLEDSKVSVGSAITDLKDNARELGLESPSSIATLKRWCTDWSNDNPAVWSQARYGDKWVLDNVLKSIKRDTHDLKVGDVLVADGHLISNDIINPATGKPCRLTLIMFYDWASCYPMGASLAYTESSEHILTALRNAILQLGIIPKFIYFDNGRAFKSKLFHEKWDDHDLSEELAGILPRLGIQAHFAKAYNGRAKVIERFFKTMQEQWERFMSGFRGASIADKPAHLARNEKWAKKMFVGKPMEYSEALDMTYYWVRHQYGNRAHSALKGKTPFQVFDARELPEDRLVDPAKLDILMLKAERKKVRKEGIVLMDNLYWDKALVDYALQPVIIRYDYCDMRSILVYDLQSRLICQATMRQSRHGFAFLSDNPLAYQEVKGELKENARLHKTIQRVTKIQVSRAKAGVERELAKHQHIKDAIMEEIKEENPLFRNPPMMPAPVKKQDVNDDVAKLEALARGINSTTENTEMDDLSSAGTASCATTGGDHIAKGSKVIVLEDLLRESEEGELANTVTFQEMQKIIGIER
jgi:putative transposase